MDRIFSNGLWLTLLSTLACITLKRAFGLYPSARNRANNWCKNNGVKLVFNWYILNLPFRLSNQDTKHVVYSDFSLTTLLARFAFRDSCRAFLRLLCSVYGTNHNKYRTNSYSIRHSYLGPTFFNLKDPFINKNDHKIQENILHNIIG